MYRGPARVHGNSDKQQHIKGKGKIQRVTPRPTISNKWNRKHRQITDMGPPPCKASAYSKTTYNFLSHTDLCITLSIIYNIYYKNKIIG